VGVAGLERDAEACALLAFLAAVPPPVALARRPGAAELRNLIDVAAAMARARSSARRAAAAISARTSPHRRRRFHGHTRLDPAGPRLVDAEPGIGDCRPC
jgi:hypothetical protein